jgi:serine protease Do
MKPNNFIRNPADCARSLFIFCIGFFFIKPLLAADLPRTVQTIKPSIVGIGSYEKTRSPAVKFVGTGFVVGDGLNVITNAHVANAAAIGDDESLGIVIGKGDQIEFRSATIVAIDPEHDLALLKISGKPLPAMRLGDSSTVVEGQSIAFTGFPLGIILGLNHATHQGIVSAITPIVMPALGSNRLDPRMIAQLRRVPYAVFQLDGTAYPGNSGSPVYDPETGVVYGVVNMVFVKGMKESAITNPSGITYAIPSKYVRDMLQAKSRPQVTDTTPLSQLFGARGGAGDEANREAD